MPSRLTIPVNSPVGVSVGEVQERSNVKREMRKGKRSRVVKWEKGKGKKDVKREKGKGKLVVLAFFILISFLNLLLDLLVYLLCS